MAIPTQHLQWSEAGSLQQLFVFDADDAFVLECHALDDPDADTFSDCTPPTARAWIEQRHVIHEWRDIPTPPKPLNPKDCENGK